MYENRHGRFTAVDPLLASGKSANPQTFNRFVYVLNDPLFFVDKNGKWPTEIHKQIIQIAFKNLSDNELEQIVYGSNLVYTLFGTGGYFDFPITLFVSEAYKHAMIPEGMSYENAYRLAQGFADSQRELATRLQGDSTDLSLKALVEFGKGTHVFSDAISPAHGPFEEYSIPKKTIQVIDKIVEGRPLLSTYGKLPECWPIPCITWKTVEVIDWKKFAEEMLEHKKREATITPEELMEAVVTLRAYFLNTFGKKKFEEVITDPAEREAVYERLRKKKKATGEASASN